MSSPQADEIATRLANIQGRIASAAQAAGRAPASVTLVAVSKTCSADAVLAAQAAGQTTFGENRVQEAAQKFGLLRTRSSHLRLHLIGGLQTNKAREAVAIADVIEVLDRPALADALERAGEREGRLPTLLVQVNVGDEAQKSGIPPDKADQFIEACQARFGLLLAGLMCIPPANVDPTPHFRALAARAVRHGLATVSMGMSADFESAIACGATVVRVGSAIFGGRLPAYAAPA